MSTASVRAVLVTDGQCAHLGTVFAAIAAATDVPPALEVVVVGDAQIHVPPDLNASVTTTLTTTYADAVNEAIGATPARDGELIWLLHDDTAPAAGALAALVATAAKRPHAAVVGAAQVRWRDESRLVSMGTTVSRIGARRIPLVIEDDIDQGQHDWREDVLAVSLGGALVRREAWDSLGGLDAGYEGFGESLEWCRRAWAAGWDVVLDPRARVRHAQESLYGLRSHGSGRASTHTVRRVSEWHHAFAWAPWWFVPVLALMVPFSIATRVLARLALSTPRLIGAELAVAVQLARRIRAIAATARTHRRVHATGVVSPRLFATPMQVFEAVRQRELGSIDSSRAQRMPSDLLRADLAATAGRRRLSFALVSLLGVALSVALAARWLAGVAAGRMVVSPIIGVTDIPARTVWNALWSGWLDVGFGAPSIDAAYAGLMMPLALLPGGLRLSLAVVLASAPLIAMMVGWWGAGHATRAPWMRLAAAAVWGLWPPFLAAVLDGRVGPVIAHVGVAGAAIGLARAVGWRRGELIAGRVERPAPLASASAAWAGSLALACATVAQPVLLLPAAAVVLVVGVRAGSRRWRVWTMLIVPVVLGAPGLVAAARQLAHPGVAASILARDPGPASTAPGSAWRMAAGIADTDRWAPSLAAAWPLGALAAVVVALAALAALASRQAARAVSMGLFLCGVGLAVSAWSTHSIARWADGAGHDAIAGWPGTGSSLAVLGALVAALAAHGVMVTGQAKRFAAGRTVAAAGAALAGIGAIAVAVALALPSAPRGQLHDADPGVLPLAVPLEQSSDTQQRVLALAMDAMGVVTYDVLTSDGTTMVLGTVQAGPDGAALHGGPRMATADDLATTVAALSVSPAGDVEALRAWGIGTIVVAADSNQVASILDQNAQVTLAGGSERGHTYHLGDGPVSRAWIEDASMSRTAIPSHATGGSLKRAKTGAGTLIIAVPDGPGWSAQADGHGLQRVDDAWGRVAFQVPEGATTVSFSYHDPVHRWWWWISAVVVVWAFLGALPVRRAREVTS